MDGTIERITSWNNGVKSNPTGSTGPKSFIGRSKVLFDMISNYLITVLMPKMRCDNMVYKHLGKH